MSVLTIALKTYSKILNRRKLRGSQPPKEDSPPTAADAPASTNEKDERNESSPATNQGTEREDTSIRSSAEPPTHEINEVDERSPQPAAGAEGLTSSLSFLSSAEIHHVLVTDATGLSAAITAVRAAAGPVGVDTETTGLDPTTDRVRLMQIATPSAVYVVDRFALGAQPPLADLFAALAVVEVVGHPHRPPTTQPPTHRQ